jgi:hypothetical protein
MCDTSRGRPPVAASRNHTRSEILRISRPVLDSLCLLGDHITHLLIPQIKRAQRQPHDRAARRARVSLDHGAIADSPVKTAPRRPLSVPAITPPLSQPTSGLVDDDAGPDIIAELRSSPLRSRQSAAQFGPACRRADSKYNVSSASSTFGCHNRWRGYSETIERVSHRCVRERPPRKHRSCRKRTGAACEPPPGAQYEPPKLRLNVTARRKKSSKCSSSPGLASSGIRSASSTKRVLPVPGAATVTAIEKSFIAKPVVVVARGSLGSRKYLRSFVSVFVRVIDL